MNFLEVILGNLERTPDKVILSEVHESGVVSTTCRQLGTDIDQVRFVLKEAGLQRGDRCALLAPNSSQWVAVDLAIMAEGGIVVPLYSRQAPAELAAMSRHARETAEREFDYHIWAPRLREFLDQRVDGTNG